MSSSRKVTQKMYKSQAEKMRGKGKETASPPKIPSQIPSKLTPAALDPSTYGIVISSAEHRDRFEKLIKKGVVATRYGDPQMLATMGIESNVNELLDAAGLTQCLAPRRTYLNFVLEFFSTLEIWHDPHSCKYTDYSLSFQLLNEKRTLTNGEIAKIYGFKTQNNREQVPPELFDVQQFWGQITLGKAYHNNNSRLTEIRNPVVKYLQKLLSSTFCGRKEVSSPRKYELEPLWNIIDRKSRDWQKDLIKCFEKVVEGLLKAKKKETKNPDPIYCGALITPILDNFNIPLPSYAPITDDFLLSGDEMERMMIVVQGFRHGSSGPAALYVYQTEGRFLRLPNPRLTYIRDLSSGMNMQLDTTAHLNESIDPSSDEIAKFGGVKKTRPVVRDRSAGSEDEGNSPATGRRKRTAASVMSPEEYQERTDARLEAVEGSISEMRAEMGAFRAEVRESHGRMMESHSKIMEFLQAIKACCTPSTSSPRGPRPSRSL